MNLLWLTCFLTATRLHSRVWVESWCLLASKLEGRFQALAHLTGVMENVLHLICRISLLPISCSTLSIVTIAIFAMRYPYAVGSYTGVESLLHCLCSIVFVSVKKRSLCFALLTALCSLLASFSFYWFLFSFLLLVNYFLPGSYVCKTCMLEYILYRTSS